MNALRPIFRALRTARAARPLAVALAIVAAVSAAPTPGAAQPRISYGGISLRIVPETDPDLVILRPGSNLATADQRDRALARALIEVRDRGFDWFRVAAGDDRGVLPPLPTEDPRPDVSDEKDGFIALVGLREPSRRAVAHRNVHEALAEVCARLRVRPTDPPTPRPVPRWSIGPRPLPWMTGLAPVEPAAVRLERDVRTPDGEPLLVSTVTEFNAPWPAAEAEERLRELAARLGANLVVVNTDPDLLDALELPARIGWQATFHVRPAAVLGIEWEPHDALRGRRIVRRLREGTPAAASDLRIGDAVVEINGVDLIHGRHAIRDRLRWVPGTRIPLVVTRDGREFTVEIETGASR